MQIFLWLLGAIIMATTFQSLVTFFIVLLIGIAITQTHNSLNARLLKLQNEHDETSLEVQSMHRIVGLNKRQLEQLSQENQALKESILRLQSNPLPTPQNTLHSTPQEPSARPQKVESVAHTPQANITTPSGTPLSTNVLPAQTTQENPPHQETLSTPPQANTDETTDETTQTKAPTTLPQTTAEEQHLTPSGGTTQATTPSKGTTQTTTPSEGTTQTTAPSDIAEPTIQEPPTQSTPDISVFEDSQAQKNATKNLPDALLSESDEQETEPFSWETFIGTKLLSYLGIGILVLGLVSLLTYSISQMGPAGRGVTGLACGAALLGIGFFLEPKLNYILFGRILMAGGWSVLYFTAYGIYHIKAMKMIQDPMAGTLLIAAVAGGMLAHTLRYRSESATGVALLLSYITLFITPVSLYTHLAGLVLGALICFFAFRFRWLITHLCGVILLYTGYGIWLYFQSPKSLPGHQTEYLLASVFLIGLWAMFKIPDFAEATSKWKHNLVPLIGLLNLAGLALVRKITHFTFQTKGAPSSALYLGALYVVLAQLMRRKGRPEIYRIESTVAVLLLMVGLWCVIPQYTNIMLSWMCLASLVIVYGLYRTERYFRDLGNLLLGASTLMALGNEWPRQVIRWFYRAGSGEMLLNIQHSALPGKEMSTLFAVGVAGAIGASLLFVSSAATFFWLKRDDKHKQPGEFGREQLALVTSVLSMMFALHALLPGLYCVLAWQALGALLFQYGLARKELTIRFWSHAVLLWSVASGTLLSLSNVHMGTTIGIGGVLLYLDAYITFRLTQKDEYVGSERTMEVALTSCATLAMMVASVYAFSTFTFLFAWIGLSSLMFAYGFARKDDVARAISHIVLFSAAIGAFVPIASEQGLVTLIGNWKTSQYVLHLLAAIIVSYIHTALIHRATGERKSPTEILQEESLLATFGNGVFLAVCWYTLPKISISIAYSIFGVLSLTVGFAWNRRYLRLHAGIALILSSFWLLTVNMGAPGLLHGWSRRLLSSLPVLGLWAYASNLWRQQLKPSNDTLQHFEQNLPLALSFLSFSAIQILIYYHAHASGLGWAAYGLILLGLVLTLGHLHHSLQALLAILMASFSFCNLATHNMGTHFNDFIRQYALWLGPITLLLAYLIIRIFQPSFKKQLDAGPQPPSPIYSWLLNKGRMLYGLLFAIISIFILTTLITPQYYALGWGCAGFILGWAGLSGRERNFRWIALSLFGMTVGKILLFDIFRFSTGQKIITFITVGIALLSVSFLYNRLKEKLADLLLKD